MERNDPRDTFDVVVVGARVAGASTAMLLARQGFDVALVDRADLPSDTLSTHALARGGVVQLDRWGLLDDVLASGAPPVRSVAFVLPEARIDRQLKVKGGFDFVVAPRRYILDAIILRAIRDRSPSAPMTSRAERTLARSDGSRRVTPVTRPVGSVRVPVTDTPVRTVTPASSAARRMIASRM